MESWEVAAREGIRDLVARYNSYGDAGRIDQQVALFAPDAVLEIVGQPVCRGPEEIRSLFSSAMGSGAEIQLIRHHVSTHQIDFESRDQATGRSYFAVYTEAGLDHWGRYLDAYRVIDGAWRFGARKVEVEGQVAGGWAERTSARLASEG